MTFPERSQRLAESSNATFLRAQPSQIARRSWISATPRRWNWAASRSSAALKLACTQAGWRSMRRTCGT
jgi:hypothetical protein